jgi:sensor histidine kinase YesM
MLKSLAKDKISGMSNWLFTTPDLISSRDRYSWLKIAGVILLCLVIATLAWFAVQAELDPIYYTAFFWIINLVLFLWFGNQLIAKILDKKLPWAQYVSRRFFVQLLFSSSYSLLCVNITFYFFRYFFTSSIPDYTQMAVVNIYGLLFIIPIISINFGVYFLVQWKKTTLQSEMLKKENIRSQLDALRSHLDPHFLFNNLNILSSLIDTDKDTATEFLNKFAEVYRYVLNKKSLEVVPLKEEIQFIESYFYILKKRFGENLNIEVDIFPDPNIFIPPLSVQLLVENAIKHNVITPEKPLTVEIYKENEKLVVINNIQRASGNNPTTKSGLENISKRYGFLTDQSVEILDIQSHFIVKLPLLTLESR